MKDRRSAFGVLAMVAALAISSMAVAAQPKLHTMIGEVKKVDTAAKTVTISGTVEKRMKQVVFHLDPETSITRNDQKVSLEDLKVGDRIVVRYSSKKGPMTAHSISLQSTKATPATLNKR